jgi:hypothetical protein
MLGGFEIYQRPPNRKGNWLGIEHDGIGRTVLDRNETELFGIEAFGLLQIANLKGNKIGT